VTKNTNNWFAGFNAIPATGSFQTLFADAGERGQEAVKRSQKAIEELTEVSKGNVEALVDAGKIAVEGARSLGQDVVETSREGVEKAADAVRALAEAKSASRVHPAAERVRSCAVRPLRRGELASDRDLREARW
jgi:hypothetical protein